MNSEHIAKQLEEIVNKGLEDLPIPYQKGNSIRIKHMIVRENSKGFLIFNSKDNCQICQVQFKSSALAIAKNLAEGRNFTQKILDLEHMLSKYYNDALFYKHTVKVTKDDTRRFNARIRLDIAVEESRRVRKILDRYIFS